MSLGEIERGCGTRSMGGIYLESPLVLGGSPLEHFIYDPPKVFDFRAMGISPLGVTLIQRQGTEIWDVWDWVGAEGYPNVTDFLEEVRRYGLSRKLSPSLDFTKLGPDSRIILIHSRAMIDDGLDTAFYHAERAPFNLMDRRLIDSTRLSGYRYCPKNRDDHTDPAFTGMCAGLWWEDLDGGEPVLSPDVPYRSVERSMPSFTYRGARRPDAFEKRTPTYTPAVFAWFAASRIAVINDPYGGKHEEALAKAKKARLDVNLEDA